MALRSEEQALLKFQNATRMREKQQNNSNGKRSYSGSSRFNNSEKLRNKDLPPAPDYNQSRSTDKLINQPIALKTRNKVLASNWTQSERKN